MNVAELLRSAVRPVEERSRAVTNPCEDLIAEVKARWERGDPVDVRELLARDPTMWKDRSVVLELAYEEYCLRVEAGEIPDPEEFSTRFPAFQNSLRVLLDAHGLYIASLESGPDEKPAPWPRPGDSFAGYALLAELGRGAFARVYLAVEPRVGNRRVALKVSRRGAITEADALGKLNHPHIVPVYSVRREPDAGVTVFCMPYLGSATLGDVQEQVFAAGRLPMHGRAILEAIRERTIAGEPVPGLLPPDPTLQTGTYVDAVVQIGARLAEALAHVHDAGIYHRDLKPSNVLLSPDGRPWLLDFNLAADQQGAGGHLGGTFPYMAQEQLDALDRSRKGDPARIDARSDVFSLGVILHELLTGRHPFGSVPADCSSAEMFGSMLESRQRGPLPIRQANPYVDRPLARVLERCLSFDPAKRPQSAAELAGALRKSLSRSRRARRWVMKHRLIVFAGMLLLLVAGFAAAAAWYRSDPAVVRHYKSGVAAYRGGQYPEAEVFFSAVLAEDKENYRAFFWRAQARKMRGEFVAAFQDLTEANKSHPDGKTRASLAYCLSKSPNPFQTRIRDNYRAAIEAGFQTPEVYNNLGYSCARLGPDNHHEGLAMLTEAIQRDPDLAIAYQNRAMLRYRVWQNLVQGALLDSTKPGQRALFLSAVEDIDQALARGVPTASMHADAARLFGILAQGGNDQSVNRFTSHLCEAIRMGESPANLQADAMVAEVLEKLGLLHLLAKPMITPTSPAETIHTVDPIKDSPD